jgi:hypothetical protein
MMWWIMIVLAVFAKMSEAGVPLPRKVVLNGDNLEILRLDIMSAEVRVSNNVKVMADRVEAVLSELVNATVFQIDIRPLISGFESLIKNAGLEARAAADAAREAVVTANATREDVQEAVAAAPSLKAAPTPGWDSWEYWWRWWQASWHTPLSAFFLGFAIYQAESRVHTVLFYVMGTFFSPYLARVVTLFVLARHFALWFRSTKRVGSAHPVRSVLLSSFGRRLGEGRGVG